MSDQQQPVLGPSRPGWDVVHHVVGRDLTLPVWRGPSHTRPGRKRAWGGSLASFIALPAISWMVAKIAGIYSPDVYAFKAIAILRNQSHNPFDLAHKYFVS